MSVSELRAVAADQYEAAQTRWDKDAAGRTQARQQCEAVVKSAQDEVNRLKRDISRMFLFVGDKYEEKRDALNAAKERLAKAQTALTAAIDSEARGKQDTDAELGPLKLALQMLESEEEGEIMLNAAVSVVAATRRDLSKMDAMEACIVMCGLLKERKESQINELAQEMQDRNSKVAEINELLAQVRNKRPTDAKDKNAWVPDNVIERLRELGVTVPDADESDADGQYHLSSAKFDALLNNGKDTADGIANAQQLDMIQLQKLTGKCQEYSDLESNLISAKKKMEDAIIRNTGT